MCALPPSTPAPSPSTSAIKPSCSYVDSQTDPEATKVPIMLTPVILVPPPALISLPEAKNGVIGNEDLANRTNSCDILKDDLGLIEAEDAILSCAQTRSQIELCKLPAHSLDICQQHEDLTNVSRLEAIVSTTAISNEKQVKSHCDINIKCSPPPTPFPSVKSYAFNHRYVSLDSNTNAPPTVSISLSTMQSKVSNHYKEDTQLIGTLLQEVSNYKENYNETSSLIVTPSPECYQVVCKSSSKPSKDFEDLPIPPTMHLSRSVIPFPSQPCTSLSTLSADVNVNRYGCLRAINIPFPSRFILCHGSVEFPATSKTIFTGNDIPSILMFTLYSWYTVSYPFWILSQAALHDWPSTAFWSLVPCRLLSSHTGPPFCTPIIPPHPPPLLSSKFRALTAQNYIWDINTSSFFALSLILQFSLSLFILSFHRYWIQLIHSVNFRFSHILTSFPGFILQAVYFAVIGLTRKSIFEVPARSDACVDAFVHVHAHTLPHFPPMPTHSYIAAMLQLLKIIGTVHYQVPLNTAIGITKGPP
ncbi:hypothetical protein BDQ17DRAFT_1435018 [Cyathus striatus]|nr:hypothetical protein BDQ17DRAFT_1435018 [Cyathus striatus]